MQTSTEVKELATALAKAQGVIASAKKDSNNPFFNSSYADLASVWECCRKPLSDNGLSVIQIMSDDGSQLQTRLCHSSGEWIEGNTPIRTGKNDMQALGSAITYARRYALMAIVGIAPEEDDGNAASEGARQQASQSKPQAKVDKKETKEPPQCTVLSSTMNKAGVATADDATLLVRWLSEFAQGDEPKFQSVTDYKKKAKESQQVLDYFTRAQESGVELTEMLKAAGEWDRNEQAVEAFGGV